MFLYLKYILYQTKFNNSLLILRYHYIPSLPYFKDIQTIIFSFRANSMCQIDKLDFLTFTRIFDNFLVIYIRT